MAPGTRAVSVPLLTCLLPPLLLCAGPSRADEVRVAVASNFAAALRTIADRFDARTGHETILAPGSTGKHYAQISQGAPFDVFFAADTHRPARLERDGMAVPGSRFTYALGTVVLWSPTPGYVDGRGEVLEAGQFHHLAMANPRLAPYGKAAQEILTARGLLDRLRPRLVWGENIGQTFRFVGSGSAELGFVAYSQIARPGTRPAGSLWRVPRALYTPIAQQAVLLRDGTAARAFLAFAQSPEALKIVADYGYEIP